MSFKMTCPHCSRGLNVTARAYGKEVPCPGCNQPISVPHPSELPQPPPAPPPQAPITAPALQSGVTQDGHTSSGRPGSLPPEIPPIPETRGAFDFVGASENGPATTKALARAVQGLKLADMFAGNEKEYVFALLPDEEQVDELVIHHQHLLLVKAGITRVTLTSDRLLYTATRVFSPIYWLLLVLFPPLILYYMFRISRNRNISLPLSTIDSIEKRYRANWIVFLVAIILGYMAASLCGKAVAAVFGGPQQNVLFNQSSRLEGVVTSVAAGLLSPVLLVVLLATRLVGIEVRSRNNHFFIRYSPEDRGASEGKMDTFFQNVHSTMERAGPAQPSPAIYEG